MPVAALPEVLALAGESGAVAGAAGEAGGAAAAMGGEGMAARAAGGAHRAPGLPSLIKPGEGAHRAPGPAQISKPPMPGAGSHSSEQGKSPTVMLNTPTTAGTQQIGAYLNSAQFSR